MSNEPHNGHSPRWADDSGILLPDGTPAREVVRDPISDAQTVAVNIAHKIALAPIRFAGAVEAIDEHLAEHPEDIPGPPALATLALLRMVARWQVEAQDAIQREADRQGHGSCDS